VFFLLLTISSNREFTKRIESIYLANGIFSAFCHACDISNFVDCETNIIDFVIIDSSISIKDLRAIYTSLKTFFEASHIGVFGDSPLHIDGATALRSREELLAFLFPLIEKSTQNRLRAKLKISFFERRAVLLGYPIALTPKEHRILMLLASEPDVVFSPENISKFAFPFDNPTSKNQVAVHVCNINKKAFPISGRALIENPHKKGYLINPNP
jgi:hypothetical protein